MKLAVLFTGGKDSLYAVHLAEKAGHEIVCLLSMKPAKDSFLFHTPNIEAARIQARQMQTSLVMVDTSGKKTQDYKKLELVLKKLKEKTGIEGIVTGAVFSVYQSSRIQKIAHHLGLYCFNPLWQTNPQSLWHELLSQGFEVMLVSVSAGGLEEKWLGKIITKKNISELFALEKKFGVSSIGEGGEFETFVLDAPLFKRKIIVTKHKDLWKGLQGIREIIQTKTQSKGKRK
jgi:asparagine synthase (glutamine-hydrolysing)